MFTERATWAELGYGLLRLPITAVALTVSVGVWAAGLVALTLPAYGFALPGGGPNIDGQVLRGPGVLVVSVVLGAALLLAAPQLTRGLAVTDAALSRGLLGPRRTRDLEARVSQLETSRERVVDAAEAERRRIERDLHDGAQQRLVALAMELGRAKAKFADDPDAARELVDQAHAQAKEALIELRNLVRGVHPPVLTERGLDAALSGLAALCPIPVDMHVDVPVRPKAAVEAVAYFMVAEALTNVAKHSRASHAKVLVEGHGFPGTLTVMVSDDGIGGADPNSPGLAGLADRVSGAQTDPLPTTYPAMEVFGFLKNDSSNLPSSDWYNITQPPAGSFPYKGIRMDVKILPYSTAGGVTVGDNNPQKRFALATAYTVPSTTDQGGTCPPPFSTNCYNYFWIPGNLPTTNPAVNDGWEPVSFLFSSFKADSGYGNDSGRHFCVQCDIPSTSYFSLVEVRG